MVVLNRVIIAEYRRRYHGVYVVSYLFEGGGGIHGTVRGGTVGRGRKRVKKGVNQWYGRLQVR